MTAEEKLQKFKALNFEDKKNKLLQIFEYAKENIDFSGTAINYLSNENPDEPVMDNLYELILNAMGIAHDRVQGEYQQKMKKGLDDLNEKSSQASDIDSIEADKLLDLINLL